MTDVSGVKLFVHSHGCLSLFGIRTPHILKGGLILPSWLSVGCVLFGNDAVKPTSEVLHSCCMLLLGVDFFFSLGQAYENQGVAQPPTRMFGIEYWKWFNALSRA